VEFPNGVSVRGQGVGVTIIRRTGTDESPIFRWNYNYSASSDPVEISGMSLYGNADAGVIDTGIWIHLRMLNFKIHDIYFQSFGYCGIWVRGYSQGVIYDCDFNDCYMAGYGYGMALMVI